MHDLIVIGGGPAGATTAALVRRQNPDKRVLILEKARFPRHHVGESLLAGIAPILARAGVLDAIEERLGSEGWLRKAGVAFLWGAEDDDRWVGDFIDPTTGRPPAGAIQVDRARFDALLLEHARGVGVSVEEEARVTSVERTDEGFVVRWEREGEHHEAPCSWIVDASGQARTLSHALGIARVPFDRMNNFAIYGYWKGSPSYVPSGRSLREGEAWSFVATTEEGWLWHVPIDAEHASVGLVTSKDAVKDVGKEGLAELYERNVMACAPVAALLENAERVHREGVPEELMVARDWSSHGATLCGEGYFLVGDAALFVDPILSSGTLLAIESASMAANALHTIWTEPGTDQELLRAGYQETYMDLAVSYHRLARIWYARSDKAESWWWEARRQELRADAEGAEVGAFLGLALGLAQDPYATRLLEGEAGVLRPDRLLVARHLHGGIVDDELGRSLARLVARQSNEEDRITAHRALMERWRALLQAQVSAEDLVTTLRDRFATDRTLDRWIRARFAECRRRVAKGDIGRLEKVVFPDGWDDWLPKGNVTLREELVDHLEHPLPSEARSLELQRLQERVLQLDLRGWLTVDSGKPPEKTDDQREALQRLAVQLVEGMVGLRVDRLGETVELVFRDQLGTLHLVPHEQVGREPFARTATCNAYYEGNREDPRLARLQDVALARLEDLEKETLSAIERVWHGLSVLAGHASWFDGEKWGYTLPDFAKQEEKRRSLMPE